MISHPLPLHSDWNLACLRWQDIHSSSSLTAQSSLDKCMDNCIDLFVFFLCSIESGIHNHIKDFDTNGVVYALAKRGPNSIQTRIIATRSSNQVGEASDILENRVDREIVSGTKAEEKSWWCVDLTENYALYLTHYTLRHGYHTSNSFLLNWQLEGSLDGENWQTLSRHDSDRSLKGNERYQTHTWAIDGDHSAFRYFRIFQTGKNSSSNLGIFLSGIELYGVLIKKGSQC